MFMPLESHHRISIRTKKQKSSVEKGQTETIRERVRAIMDKEKRREFSKVREETQGKLKELLRQMKPKNTPSKEEKNRESDLRYT